MSNKKKGENNILIEYDELIEAYDTLGRIKSEVEELRRTIRKVEKKKRYEKTE